MIFTQHAAVHIGNDIWIIYMQPKRGPQRTVKTLFDVTSKLFPEQTDIQGISLIDWQENSWK